MKDYEDQPGPSFLRLRRKDSSTRERDGAEKEDREVEKRPPKLEKEKE